MKKKYLIASIIIAIIGALLIIAMINLNSLLETVRPKVAETLSSQLKTTVSIGKITAHFFPQVSLELNGVKLEESKEQASQLGKILIAPRFLDLLKGTVALQAFSIENSKITISKDKDGVLSVAGIKLKQEATAATPPTMVSNVQTALPATETKTPLAFAIQVITVKNSQLTYLEEGKENFKPITIGAINLKLTDISPQGQLKINGGANIFSSKPDNFNINGQAELVNFNFAQAKANIALKFTDLDLARAKETALPYAQSLSELDVSGAADLELKLSTIERGLQINLAFDAQKAELNYPNTIAKESGVRFGLSSIIEIVATDNSRPITEIRTKDARLELHEATIPFEFIAALGEKGKLAIGNGEPVKLEPLRKIIPPFETYLARGQILPRLNIFYYEQAVLTPNQKPIEPRGTVEFKDVAFTLVGQNGQPDKNLTQLNGAISLLAKEKTIVDLSARYRNYPLKLELRTRRDVDKIIIEPSRFIGLSGVINYYGEIADQLPKPYKMTVNGLGFDVASTLNVLDKQGDMQITGSVEKLAANLTGDLKAEPAKKPEGRIDLSIQKGSIKGVNILSQTLGAAKNLPGVSDGLAVFIPHKYKPLIDSSDTAFDRMIIELGLYQDKLNISNLELIHSAYSIKGNGTMLGDNLDLSMRLTLNTTLTQDMITQNKAIALAQDENKNIVIPLTIKKEGGSTMVLPDLQAILDRAAKNSLKEAAVKALDKATGGLGGAIKSLLP
ncbi:MAG: hypothetical protein IT292_09270 [Deltaproteobacteria bacterium]|nr:hypothetical protein [Deltaproteobacteria bacterium]